MKHIAVYDRLAAYERARYGERNTRRILRRRGLRHGGVFELRHALDVLAVIHQGSAGRPVGRPPMARD